MNESISLDDMGIFAQVAQQGSFTAAARVLAMPKQTVSRRVAELEEALGLQLLVRTTRSMRLTGPGAAYAERCAQLVRLAGEANRALLDDSAEPRGTLRLSADPLFGETFLPPLISDYLQRHAGAEVQVVLTQRKVDLVEEGFDLVFRVGRPQDSSLRAVRLGPARVCYCASPAYLVGPLPCGCPLT